MEYRLDLEWTRHHLSQRRRDAHKGVFGTLGILAGSERYRGAAVLAAAGALRSGTGLVRVASVNSVCNAVAAQLPCCIVQPLPQNAGGGVAASALLSVLGERCTAILAGCGLGNTVDTAALVEGILAGTGCPLVLDADALNVISGQLDIGRDPALRARCLAALAVPGRVITPHIGEMARLCGKPVDEVAEKQREVAQNFARAWGCVVVLKSHDTVVATPGGDLYVNDKAGNPGLAKGGSGDVLAGIIAGLLAQRVEPAVAAAAGVWLHAAAADRVAAKYGEAGLSPADLPAAMGEVWLQVERDKEKKR